MMKRFGVKIGRSLLICIAAILVELLTYAMLLSRYALHHWWSVGSLGSVTLHAVFLIVALMSLLVGYLTGGMWPLVAAQIVLFGTRAVCIGVVDALMQGFEFPVAVLSAGMFGWIGARLRLTKNCSG